MSGASPYFAMANIKKLRAIHRTARKFTGNQIDGRKLAAMDEPHLLAYLTASCASLEMNWNDLNNWNNRYNQNTPKQGDQIMRLSAAQMNAAINIALAGIKVTFRRHIYIDIKTTLPTYNHGQGLQITALLPQFRAPT